MSKGDEDEWWEVVFAEKDMRAVDNGCDRECFSFACRCRREAVAHVANLTGVSYEDTLNQAVGCNCQDGP